MLLVLYLQESDEKQFMPNHNYSLEIHRFKSSTEETFNGKKIKNGGEKVRFF